MAVKLPTEKGKNIGEPIAIICGYGDLPREVALGAIAAGRCPFLVGIEGEADSSIESFDHQYINLGQLGLFLKLLKKRGISQVVMAGGVYSRPKVSGLKLDWEAIKLLPAIMALFLGGDNKLLSGLIKLLKKKKIEVVGSHEVAPELLASAGVISGYQPDRMDMHNIRLAAAACHELGKLDIGQAAIAESGRIVAVEGAEGTDSLIERVIELRKSGRLPEKSKNGVLVKLMKSGQDPRVDMPAIGPQTILGIKAAGLKGVAVDSGKSLILQRNRTVQLSIKNGIYIYGYESSGKALT